VVKTTAVPATGSGVIARPIQPAKMCSRLAPSAPQIHSEHVLAGTLQDAARQHDDPTQRGAPNNIWPADRSWLISTNYDLSATRVSGTSRLIAILRHHPELETVDLARP
jgi:hypothetical protein